MVLMFPTDNTQWSDWDEDGFGDNYGNLSWTDRNETGRVNITSTLETKMVSNISW